MLFTSSTSRSSRCISFLFQRQSRPTSLLTVSSRPQSDSYQCILPEWLPLKTYNVIRVRLAEAFGRQKQFCRCVHMCVCQDHYCARAYSAIFQSQNSLFKASVGPAQITVSPVSPLYCCYTDQPLTTLHFLALHRKRDEH